MCDEAFKGVNFSWTCYPVARVFSGCKLIYKGSDIKGFNSSCQSKIIKGYLMSEKFRISYPDVIILQSTDELLSNGDSTKGSSVSPPHGHLSLQRCTHNGDYIPSNHGDWNIHAGGYHTLGRHESQSHSGVPPISSYISKFNFISCFGACQQ